MQTNLLPSWLQISGSCSLECTQSQCHSLRLPVSLMPHVRTLVTHFEQWYAWAWMTGVEHPVVLSGSSMGQTKAGGHWPYYVSLNLKVPHHVMKLYKGNYDTAPLIFHLRTRCGSLVILQAPAILSPWKNPSARLDFLEMGKIFCSWGARSPVPSSLLQHHRLRYPGSKLNSRVNTRFTAQLKPDVQTCAILESTSRLESSGYDAVYGSFGETCRLHLHNKLTCLTSPLLRVFRRATAQYPSKYS